MKLGRWTSGILLGRWMSVIFFGPKMESHEDMWNPLCFHGTGLHLPTRRRRWQSVKGIQVWNPKKHSHSCSSWQLPMVAVHAGPRHLLGIMVLWCYSLFSETCYFVVLALFCGSGTPFSWKLGRENGSHQWTWCRCWLWFGDGVYAFTEAGVKKPYRIAEMWGQCIQRSNPFKSLVIPAMLQFCWVSVVISCIGDIGVEWGCRIVIYGAFACGYVLPIVSWGRITIQFVPFVAVFFHVFPLIHPSLFCVWMQWFNETYLHRWSHVSQKCEWSLVHFPLRIPFSRYFLPISPSYYIYIYYFGEPNNKPP